MHMVETNTAVNKTITAVHKAGSDFKWAITLQDGLGDIAGSHQLQLVNLSSEHKLDCPVLSVEEDANGGVTIETDLSPLKATVENCKSEKWKVLLDGLVLTGTETDTAAGAQKKDPFRRRLEFFETPLGQMDFEGRTVEAVPFLNTGGEWQVSVGDKCLRYMQAFKCLGLDESVRQNSIVLKASCPVLKDFTPKGMMVSYKYQLEKDREDHFFPLSSVTKEKDRIVVIADIDLDTIEFRPLFWDVRMVFEKDGEEYWSNIRSAGLSKKASKAGNIQARVRNLFSRHSAKTDNGYRIFVSETPYNNTTFLVQQPGPYSGFGFRLKERLALLIYGLFKKQLERKKIFLVHEKFCSAAQDNGYYFFRFCMENGMEEKMHRSIFYVIDKSQQDYANLLPYKDHVIQFMSLKHMVYSLAAKLIIASESKLHSYAWRSAESIIRPRILSGKKLVFLQHGVIGLKRVDAFKKGLPADSDMFITSNDLERSFIINDLGYAPDEVVVTGLSRWDVLEDKSAIVENKRILVMPTWRKWLDEASDEVFLASEYYHRYMDLINSPKLAEILRDNDLYLDFYIHPKLSELLGKFSASDDRIRLIPFGTEPLNELMMECRLLITDYSSVCWDVYYQGKPVIFYQFDLAKYNETQGAYMDLEKDLFGDRAETQDKLLELLKDAVSRGFTLKPEYAKMRGNMYKHIDHNNSLRICEEIIKRKW